MGVRNLFLRWQPRRRWLVGADGAGRSDVGNDPDLNQAAFDAGKRVTQSWINPDLRTPQHLGYPR